MPRAEGSLEHDVLRRIVMNPTGLHALEVNGLPHVCSRPFARNQY
jgi:hypothetical protein